MLRTHKKRKFGPPTPLPHIHTHYRKQIKGKQHSRMQEKLSNLEKFASEERKQSKNHCSSVKLESKKQDKKIIDPGRDWAEKLQSSVQEEPRPIY